MVSRHHMLEGTVEIDHFYFGAQSKKHPDGPPPGKSRKDQKKTRKTAVLAMVQRPADTAPGTSAGDARAAVVSSLSCCDTELIVEYQIPPMTTLVSDEWKAFMAIGKSFARHESVNHSRGEYVCGSAHINSTEGFSSRVQRTIAGVFHHISPKHADLYFNEIGFRWSQRIATGTTTRKTRKGREVTRTLWSRVSPALQLPNVFRTIVGRQMRRSSDGGIIIKSEIALFG